LCTRNKCLDKSVIDSDSSESSSYSKADDKKGTIKVAGTKHLLKPLKFDGIKSFETFWAHLRQRKQLISVSVFEVISISVNFSVNLFYVITYM